MDDLLEKIEQYRKELSDILAKVHSGQDFAITWDRIGRWKERTKKLILSKISEDEAKKFENSGPVSFSMTDGFENINDYVRYHDSHLQALAEDIKNNPEFYTNPSIKEEKKPIMATDLPKGLHPIIYSKCKKLYDDHSFSIELAVEHTPCG